MDRQVLIAQLSDVHVRPRGQLYKGVADSNRMFREAIAHLHGLDRRPDRSGDRFTIALTITRSGLWPLIRARRGRTTATSTPPA